MRVGVIGSNGFIGKHICLGLLYGEDFTVTEIEKRDCIEVESLSKKTDNIDALIVAGGVNRADSDDIVYGENIQMVQTIIDTLSAQNYKGRVIFLSSTQNTRDNAYGRSKRDSEEILREFASKHEIDLTILVLPNIFGESQKPYYNCVVPTFIHQILKDEQSKIADAEMELLHVRHVVILIKDILGTSNNVSESIFRPEGEIVNVKNLYEIITDFCTYKDAKVGIIPTFSSFLHLDLFNTFRYICWELQMNLSGNFVSHGDDRGQLFELVKTHTSGQVMFSTTKPGLARGGHFHTRKIERFCLLSGQSIVSAESVFGDFSTTIDCSSEDGTFVDIPNYTVHRMENIGTEEVIGVFWINEIYNQNDGDTYSEIIK